MSEYFLLLAVLILCIVLISFFRDQREKKDYSRRYFGFSPFGNDLKRKPQNEEILPRRRHWRKREEDEISQAGLNDSNVINNTIIKDNKNMILKLLKEEKKRKSIQELKEFISSLNP